MFVCNCVFIFSIQFLFIVSFRVRFYFDSPSIPCPRFLCMCVCIGIITLSFSFSSVLFLFSPNFDSLSMSVCVCVYVCMSCVCAHVCLCVCAHVCICAFACVCFKDISSLPLLCSTQRLVCVSRSPSHRSPPRSRSFAPWLPRYVGCSVASCVRHSLLSLHPLTSMNLAVAGEDACSPGCRLDPLTCEGGCRHLETWQHNAFVCPAMVVQKTVMASLHSCVLNSVKTHSVC